MLQRLSLHQLHHDVRLPLGQRERLNAHHVRMVEVGPQPHFPIEAAPRHPPSQTGSPAAPSPHVAHRRRCRGIPSPSAMPSRRSIRYGPIVDGRPYLSCRERFKFNRSAQGNALLSKERQQHHSRHKDAGSHQQPDGTRQVDLRRDDDFDIPWGFITGYPASPALVAERVCIADGIQATRLPIIKPRKIGFRQRTGGP